MTSSLELLLQYVRSILGAVLITTWLCKDKFYNRFDYLFVWVLTCTALTAIDVGLFIVRYIAGKDDVYFLFMAFLWFINVVNHALDMRKD